MRRRLISVRSLSRLLSTFGVNERLVRTSLTRLVNDGLLTTTTEGRRSFYRVAAQALDLFRQADHRIYHGTAERVGRLVDDRRDRRRPGTPRRRAQLRQELAWAGLGSVAPNVMASPIVPGRGCRTCRGPRGRFRQRARVRDRAWSRATARSAPTSWRTACAALEEIAGRYENFIERYEQYSSGDLAQLVPELAFKLRTLLVAEFRRIALSDPQLPALLLPTDSIGKLRARRLAGEIYRTVATGLGTIPACHRTSRRSPPRRRSPIGSRRSGVVVDHDVSGDRVRLAGEHVTA